MDDLFNVSSPHAQADSPLADRMRPQVLDDIIGQDHILGPGRLLRRAIQADRLSSIILYGPPGTGKTSLARVIANTTRSVFESLNAVLTGIKDIREVIDRSDERRRLYSRRTILFVDEVHRWNKAQQDALLPWVENGTVILIGATTENPFFEVNRALVSRSRIFQLKSLTSEDLHKAALRCLADTERGYGKWQVEFLNGALEHLVEVAGGDARSLLNALELAIETSANHWPPEEGSEICVTLEAAEESIQRRALLYDRDGDYHYDTISAFIKSIRGSDPDGALYWLAKMVRAGEDPAFLFRRMIISSMEDVGLADPQAITTVISCAEAFDRIGYPEGNFALSLACLYLATAPKSNTTLAYFDALKEVERQDAEVPNHLRDASRDAEGFGHGEGYIYPHAYREHWAAQQYLPSALRGRIFYNPSESGFEGRIREGVLLKREIQGAVILSDTGDGEILSWSAASRGREGWFKRLESGRGAQLLSDRDVIFSRCSIARHHRILIAAADEGLLIWESLRRVPEGLAAALVESPQSKEALERFYQGLDPNLDPSEGPIIHSQKGLPSPQEAELHFGSPQFDHIIAREPWRRTRGGTEAFKTFSQGAALLLAPGGSLVILMSPPALGERLSRILREDLGAPSDLTASLSQAEEAFFNAASPLLKDDPVKADPGSWAWDSSHLVSAFQDAGFKVDITEIDQREERLLTDKDLSAWFNQEKSSWGAFIAASLGEKDFNQIHSILEEGIKKGPLTWKWKSLLLKGDI
ncbi:MAG: AAA family ATPase [Treponema sp.]|nr:AAA family ATPase [Treponema sp.]